MHRLIVIILLVLGIFFSVMLVSQKTSFFSKASPDISPGNVTISNISDSSFTVSWVTDKPTIGFIKYSQDSSFNQTEVDARDAGGPQARVTHLVVLKNLSSAQNYFFQVASQDQLFGDGDQPFQQMTAPAAEETPSVPILTFGKLKKKNGEVPKEAIIYLKLPSSTTLSTTSGDDGNFLITVTNARQTDLSSYVDVKDGDSAEIWVQAGDDGNLPGQPIKISSKEALPDLILEEPVLPAPSPDNIVHDFNNDGLINAFDYAIWIKRKLNF